MAATSVPLKTSHSRKWLFRGMSVLLALFPFALMELVCVTCGWGQPDPGTDPFVEFSSIQPLFEKQDDKFIISPARRNFFAHDEFPIQKPKDGFRIFCLGGSTVQGRPYSIETSFTTWLELALQEMDANTRWDVINCGGISYASYRLVPILEECLEYEPDLIILCTGHNEFLEKRQYTAAMSRPLWLQNSFSQMQKVRTVNVLSQLIGRADSKTMLSTEVQARLDFQKGLDSFHRDWQWADKVERHFITNLQRMIQIAHNQEIPIVLVKPCSNLAGTRPFKSEDNPGMSAQYLELTKQLQKVRQLAATDLDQANTLLHEIQSMHSQNASVWYEAGKLSILAGNTESALYELKRARDLDVCPLRMTSKLEEGMEKLAKRYDVPLLDAHQLLQSKTDSGVLGDFWLVDHVHPSFSGHQEIAIALAKQLRDMQTVIGTDGWKQRARTSFAAHFQSLDRNYFHRGQRMLKALKGWTRQTPYLPPTDTDVNHGG